MTLEQRLRDAFAQIAADIKASKSKVVHQATTQDVLIVSSGQVDLFILDLDVGFWNVRTDLTCMTQGGGSGVMDLLHVFGTAEGTVRGASIKRSRPLPILVGR